MLPSLHTVLVGLVDNGYEGFYRVTDPDPDRNPLTTTYYAWEQTGVNWIHLADMVTEVSEMYSCLYGPHDPQTHSIPEPWAE